MEDYTLWVIAYTAAGNYMGRATYVAHVGESVPFTSPSEIEIAFEKSSKIFLAPCYSFLDQYLVSESSQGPQIMQQTMVLPLGKSVHEKSGLWITPTNIKLLANEDSEDRELYVQLIERAKEHAFLIRARRSGISLADAPLDKLGRRLT